MSKIDRQLDEITGAKPISIRWPLTDEHYIRLLRENVKRELDGIAFRVPLDLRGVKGAPAGLVDMIYEMQAYAESKDKQLTIAYALPAMREALDPSLARNKSVRADQSDAGVSARQALSKQFNTVNSERIEQAAMAVEDPEPILNTPARKPRPSWKRYGVLACYVLVGTLLVGVIEYFIMFNQDERILYNEKDMNVKILE